MRQPKDNTLMFEQSLQQLKEKNLTLHASELRKAGLLDMSWAFIKAAPVVIISLLSLFLSLYIATTELQAELANAVSAFLGMAAAFFFLAFALFGLVIVFYSSKTAKARDDIAKVEDEIYERLRLAKDEFRKVPGWLMTQPDYDHIEFKDKKRENIEELEKKVDKTRHQDMIHVDKNLTEDLEKAIGQTNGFCNMSHEFYNLVAPQLVSYCKRDNLQNLSPEKGAPTVRAVFRAALWKDSEIERTDLPPEVLNPTNKLEKEVLDNLRAEKSDSNPFPLLLEQKEVLNLAKNLDLVRKNQRETSGSVKQRIRTQFGETLIAVGP